jgi:hypothetical protein
MISETNRGKESAQDPKENGPHVSSFIHSAHHLEWLGSDSGWITGNPEVVGSSF